MADGQLLRPEDRYGRQRMSRRSGRWLAVVLAVLVVTIGAVAAVIGYQRINESDVKGEMVAYRLIDDQTVEVTFNVTRSDPDQAAVCIIRGRSRDGSETGRRELLVPPSSDTTVQVTGLVKTSRPPAVGDVYGCGTNVPDYLIAP
ncbi:hypothetical protein BVC93_17745 [Mycobacterium sp. MS1601]|uniref:DUF4307 domain-containing protein n=1 Tax=Mycobacterium sp. MS1601 TaxID=1936029 RepID=UPI0009794BBD|nr:DUF4307 domain-containing protein [Mycobacterium sp. MS1601]AQA03968.1 hypothetical protein BVC93_17745 [Mycobacterium sp. MS1601]